MLADGPKDDERGAEAEQVHGAPQAMEHRGAFERSLQLRIVVLEHRARAAKLCCKHAWNARSNQRHVPDAKNKYCYGRGGCLSKG